MKRVLITLLSLLVFTLATQAQEDPGKALSKAGKALSSYNLDPSSNAAKLDEAISMIEIAAKSSETNSDVKTWQTRGEIYTAVADADFKQIIVNPEFIPTDRSIEASFKAVESFKKALELAQKKYQTRDALKGLKEIGQKINMFANQLIKGQQYGKAAKLLELVFEVDDILKNKGEEGIIQPEEFDNTTFVMAYCFQIDGKKDKAIKYYQQLYEKGTEEPTVYAQLFNLLNEKEDPKALEVLEAGRKKFPEDTEILFAEINYYIKLEKYDVLEQKLKEAIEREPNNPSVYSALGNVYMNLFQEEFEKNGDSDLAKQYFQNALNYLEKAIELDPKKFDAYYSIGSMYYNKAVILVKQANELPLSENKKYEELMAQSTELMNTALPYFKKAEAINPNDINTLIALKEIFARRNEFDLVKEFTTRLEKVQNGEENTEPYFKNQ